MFIRTEQFGGGQGPKGRLVLLLGEGGGLKELAVGGIGEQGAEGETRLASYRRGGACKELARGVIGEQKK